MVVPVVFFSRNLGLKNTKTRKWQKVLGIILYATVMIVQAAFGSGIGILLMFIVMGLLGFDALKANATKRVIGLVLVTMSVLFFAFTGLIDWMLFFTLAISMYAGGYIGAHWAVKFGNKLVKNALLIAALIMGITILL